MLFIVPYDQIGVTPPGPWQNAAPSSGVEGSIVNADVFPAVQQEILNVITAAGLTPSPSDFTQLEQAIVALIGSGRIHISEDASANATTIAATFAVSSFVQDNVYIVGAAHTCAGATSLTSSSLNTTVVRNDGSALQANDWLGGGRLVMVYDGTKMRLTDLTVPQVQALAATAASTTTTVSPTIQNYVSKYTPAGSTKLSAFTANIVVSDIASSSFTTVQSTGQFSGATGIRVSGSCGMRSTDTSGALTSYTARLVLTCVTDGGIGYGPYLGGGTTQTSGSGQTQLPFTVPSFSWQLDPTKTYYLGIVCQKGSTTGAIQVYDPEIYAEHDGTNH